MQYINSPAQLGKILAARRKTLNLSQQDLAARLGISQNRLSELERQTVRLTVERLLNLLNVLGLELVVRERTSASKASKIEW